MKSLMMTQLILEKYFNKNYIEISRTGKDFEEEYLSYAIELADKHNSLVATNDVRFLNKKIFRHTR